MVKQELKNIQSEFSLTECYVCGEPKPVEFYWIKDGNMILLCRECYEGLDDKHGLA